MESHEHSPRITRYATLIDASNTSNRTSAHESGGRQCLERVPKHAPRDTPKAESAHERATHHWADRSAEPWKPDIHSRTDAPPPRREIDSRTRAAPPERITRTRPIERSGSGADKTGSPSKGAGLISPRSLGSGSRDPGQHHTAGSVDHSAERQSQIQSWIRGSVW